MKLQRSARRTRGLAAVAVGLAAALAVTGCSGSGSGDESNGSNGSGKTTISLWQYYGDPDMPTGKPFYDLVDGYEKENPDVKVKIRYVPFPDFNRTLLQSAAGGNLPDIALINAFDTATMAKGGVIQDLSGRVKKWGQKDHYFKTSWETTQYDGKTYGIPHVADAYAVYYNKTLFGDAGLTPPKTWKEMQTTAKSLAVNGHYGLAVAGVEGVGGATAQVIRLLANGVEPSKIDNAAGEAAFNSFNELVDSGAMSKGILTWNEDDIYHQFATGQAAMMINSATYVNTMKKEYPDLKWGVALLPKGTKSNKTFLSAENLTICTGSKHADAAWDLIKYMQKPKVLAQYLPARNKLPARDDVTIKDPTRQVFADQLKSAWAPKGKVASSSAKVFTYIQKAMQEVISGSASAADAVKSGQASIDDALSQQ